MGFRRFEQIHDLDWTYQFDIRYCHLHGDVVGVQVPGAGHGIPLPVGLVYRGLAFQTLIVHTIRTRKVPFIQSSASWPVMLMTFSIIAVGICIPFSSFGSSIGLSPLPWTYFPWLAGILLSYCVLTQWLKTLYIRAFKRWL